MPRTVHNPPLEEWAGRGWSETAQNWAVRMQAFKLEWADVPASATATGKAGQLAYESGFLYICVADNTWMRAAVAAW